MSEAPLPLPFFKAEASLFSAFGQMNKRTNRFATRTRYVLVLILSLCLISAARNASTPVATRLRWPVSTPLRNLCLEPIMPSGWLRPLSGLRLTQLSILHSVRPGAATPPAGIGPALGYLIPGEKSTSVAEIRWLPELEKSERLRGDYFWFKLAYEF